MKWLKKFLSIPISIILVPHSSKAPKQIVLSTSFIIFLVFLWTSITIFATYITTRHFDYWGTSVANMLMKLKVNYLISKMQEERAWLEELKKHEAKLKALLELKNPRRIVSHENIESKGGPTKNDYKVIEIMLKNKEPDLVSLVELKNIYRTEIYQIKREIEDTLKNIELRRKLFRSIPNIWPAQGYKTSHFGYRLDPLYGGFEFHHGVDISGDYGQPIRATADGIVEYTGWLGGYGRLVIIDHGFGFKTRYGHCSKILVKPGDKVKRGDKIATIGSTGKATGPHVHYEVFFRGKSVNPGRFLNEEIAYTISLSKNIKEYVW
ncbi:MAG: M23 family metallopeptidase [bacterium]|nr:M23 family metallopeptidase [bacterium]